MRWVGWLVMAGALGGCAPDGEDLAAAGDESAGEADDGPNGGASSDPEPDPPPPPADAELVPLGTRVAITTVTGPLDDGAWPGAVEIVDVIDGEVEREVLFESDFPTVGELLPSVRTPLVRGGPGWLTASHPSGYLGDDPYAVRTYRTSGQLPVDVDRQHRMRHDTLGTGLDRLYAVDEFLLAVADGRLYQIDLTDDSGGERAQNVERTEVLGTSRLLFVEAGADEALRLWDDGEIHTLFETEGRIVTYEVAADDNTVVLAVESGDGGQVVVAYANEERAPWVAMQTTWPFPILLEVAPDASAVLIEDFLEPGVPRPHHLGLDADDMVELSDTLVWGEYSRYADWLVFAQYQVTGARLMDRSTGELGDVPVPYEAGAIETCGSGAAVGAYAEGNGLHWAPFESSEELTSLTGQSVVHLRCAPDHRWLAWAAQDGSVWIASIGAEAPGDPIEVEASGYPVRELTWSPGGQHLLLERCRAGTGEGEIPCEGSLAAWHIESKTRTLLHEGQYVNARTLPLH